MRRADRQLIVDVVGPYGGPEGDGANFLVTLGDDGTLAIAAGHYYVDGLLCEAERATTYYDQPYAFLDPALPGDRLPAAGPFLVYLKAWEPDAEADRSAVLWQVLACADFPPGSGERIADWPTIDPATAHRRWADWGRLQADPPRPALLARADPFAGYRGLENQLYRVEVHVGGGAGATFKWSRENGAVAFPIESLSGDTATVAGMRPVRRRRLAVGDWVELLDDSSVMRGERHPLVRVARVDRAAHTVVLTAPPYVGVAHDLSLHPFLRRWDHGRGAGLLDAATGTLEVPAGWIELERGVQVQFRPGAGGYTPGDYWVIPARTQTGDVEWPTDGGAPVWRPPAGPEYSFAPLSLVDAAGTAHDLRSTFAPAAKPRP